MEKRKESLLLSNNSENFPNQGRGKDTQAQEAQRTLSKIIPARLLQDIIKMLKIKHKRTLKAQEINDTSYISEHP